MYVLPKKSGTLVNIKIQTSYLLIVVNSILIVSFNIDGTRVQLFVRAFLLAFLLVDY